MEAIRHPALVFIALFAVAGLSALGVTSAYGTVPGGPSDGLVLRYAFDTQANGVIPDLSGNGFDGTLMNANAAKALVPSLPGYGKAVRLRGQQHQYVDVPTQQVLDLDHFTLSAWVRYTGVENDMTFGRWEVLEKAGAYWLNVRTTGALRAGGFFGGCTSASWRYLDSNRVIATNVWRHVAATYDGSKLTLFIAGKRAGSMAVSGQTCASGEPLAVGAKNNPTKGLLEAFWDGRLDEVRLYDRALSSTEIGELAARQ